MDRTLRNLIRSGIVVLSLTAPVFPASAGQAGDGSPHSQLLLAQAGPATAPPQHSSPTKAQMEAGKGFFLRGQQLYQEGKYEAAWLEFSSAYEIAPLPDLVFNMARYEVKMNRLKEAVGHYREFLAARPDDQESDRIRDEIVRLERQLQGLADPLPVPPPPPPEPKRRFPIISAALGGGTVLFLIFGGIGVGVANSRYSDLQGSCGTKCSNDQVQTVKTPLYAGDAMFGLAAAAAVATAVMLPFELGLFEKKKDPKVSAGVGLGSVYVLGRF